MSTESGPNHSKELAGVQPRFFWAVKESAPVQTGLERWFSTREFRAQQLAAYFPAFANLVNHHGVLQDLSYTVTVLRDGSEAHNNHLALHLSQTRRLVAFLHGWAGSREAWGHFPQLVTLFATSNPATFNIDMPGMGRSGYRAGVNGFYQTPEGIARTILDAYETLGIESPAPGQTVIHALHSMGPTLALGYWQEQLRDPQHGFALFAPFLPELSRTHRFLSRGLGIGMGIAGPVVGQLASPLVTRIWGGPHTEGYVGRAHRQTVGMTDPRMLARTMTALTLEQPLAQLKTTQGLKGTNLLFVAADNDLFTPGREAIAAAQAAGLEPEKTLLVPGAGHYGLFSTKLLNPPPGLAPNREALADWVRKQASQQPKSHFARVVGLAQRMAAFVDSSFEN